MPAAGTVRHPCQRRAVPPYRGTSLLKPLLRKVGRADTVRPHVRGGQCPPYRAPYRGTSLLKPLLRKVGRADTVRRHVRGGQCPSYRGTSLSKPLLRKVRSGKAVLVSP